MSNKKNATKDQRDLIDLLGVGRTIVNQLFEGVLSEEQPPELTFWEWLECWRSLRNIVTPEIWRQRFLQVVSKELKGADFNKCEEMLVLISPSLEHINQEPLEMLFSRMARIARKEKDLLLVSEKAAPESKAENISRTKILKRAKNLSTTMRLIKRTLNNHQQELSLITIACDQASTLVETREILDWMTGKDLKRQGPGGGQEVALRIKRLTRIEKGAPLQLILEKHLSLSREFKDVLVTVWAFQSVEGELNPFSLEPKPKIVLPWFHAFWKDLENQLCKTASTGDDWADIWDIVHGDKDLADLTDFSWEKVLEHDDTSIATLCHLWQRNSNSSRGWDHRMLEKLLRKAKTFEDWFTILRKGPTDRWKDILEKMAVIAKTIDHCQTVRNQASASNLSTWKEQLLAPLIEKEIRLAKTAKQLKKAVEGLPVDKHWTVPLIRSALRKWVRLKN